jgi:hypothetical protein
MSRKPVPIFPFSTSSQPPNELILLFAQWVDDSKKADCHISQANSRHSLALLHGLGREYFDIEDKMPSVLKDERAVFNAQCRLMNKVFDILLFAHGLEKFPVEYWHLYQNHPLYVWGELVKERYLLGGYDDELITTKTAWIKTFTQENRTLRSYENPFPEGSHTHAFWQNLTNIVERPKQNKAKSLWDEFLNLRSNLGSISRKQGKFASASKGVVLRGNRGKVQYLKQCTAVTVAV